MSVLVQVAQFLLSLSLLIIIHELGHFIFAKVFKCRVEKFYLFFNPWFALFKTKRGETEYGVGWLPLGGYVKISGMIDESMDKEQMKQPPQPYEFRSKPSGQRLLIMIGGVLMNFIAALIIYIGVLYAWGEKYLPTSEAKYGIVASSTGEKVGFQTGDKILSVDGENVEDFYELVPYIVLEQAKTVQVERNEQLISVEISDEDIALMMKNPTLFDVRVPFEVTISDFAKTSPARDAGLQKGDKVVMIDSIRFQFVDEFQSIVKKSGGQTLSVTVDRNGEEVTVPVAVDENGMMGISYPNTTAEYFSMATLEYGLIESIPAGIKKGWKTSVDYVKQFKLIFNKKTKGYENLGGFITIGSIFPKIWDWHSFWNMTAFLSIILGIMNILPIPALDGGHVMFVLYEMITGRKPSEKFLEYAQLVGLALLLLLVLYANANDVIKLFR